MISHWITPWRAAAVNYCFKDESPHHTSHTNGVSVVGTPFSLWPTITKYGFQCYLAEREAAICTIVVRETKACPLPSSATTHLRGCRVAESLPVPRQWMRHHSAWLLQLPWGLWPDTPLGPHYVNNSIFSSNVDKNTGFLQQRLKARINIFTFFFSFFFFLLQSETFPLRIWKVNRQSLRNSDDSQLDSSKARLTKSRGRTGQKAEHRGKALLRGKELLWKQRELHPEN